MSRRVNVRVCVCMFVGKTDNGVCVRACARRGAGMLGWLQLAYACSGVCVWGEWGGGGRRRCAIAQINIAALVGSHILGFSEFSAVVCG